MVIPNNFQHNLNTSWGLVVVENFSKQFSSLVTQDTGDWSTFEEAQGSLTFDGANNNIEHNATGGSNFCNITFNKILSDFMFVVKMKRSTTDEFIGLRFRTDFGDNGYEFTWDSGATPTFVLKRLDSGTPTTLDTSAVQTINNDTWYYVAVKCEGSDLRGYLDGVEICQATDTNYISGNNQVTFFLTPGTGSDVGSVGYFALWTKLKQTNDVLTGN